MKYLLKFALTVSFVAAQSPSYTLRNAACGDLLVGSTVGEPNISIEDTGSNARLGGKVVYEIYVGDSDLTVTTCSVHTNYDTALWIFPDTDLDANIALEDDDACDAISLDSSEIPTEYVYVVVGGYAHYLDANIALEDDDACDAISLDSSEIPTEYVYVVVGGYAHEEGTFGVSFDCDIDEPVVTLSDLDDLKNEIITAVVDQLKDAIMESQQTIIGDIQAEAAFVIQTRISGLQAQMDQLASAFD